MSGDLKVSCKILPVLVAIYAVFLREVRFKDDGDLLPSFTACNATISTTYHIINASLITCEQM